EGRLDLQGGGLLASLNYLGYFLGAVSCASLRVRAATMVRGGLVATAALLLGMGLLHGFTTWGALRTLAGVMSAWVFVFASG
ncbi:YbfB/YjiJ family MFS transporter, partial [Klebsiella pneumoniae]|uniref:YbfB/YjiJ family MFS transporter n=1 Tax=Klebsiella pneumoniae TaxID=573 RepID=UPI003013B118